MSHTKARWAAVILVCGSSGAAPAWADLYQAGEAYERKDFARAYELYRVLAELGHPEAQESLAVMYVNAEGLKRDNVLGYAWASMAIDNGAGEASRSIVSQLEPHLTDGARARVAELRAQFGNEALRKTLLPVDAAPRDWRQLPCKMVSPANPDFYYPEHARTNFIRGMALVQARILPDGSARNPTVWFSFPVGEFDQSARAVALQSRYASTAAEGEPCTMLFKVKYSMPGSKNDLTDEAAKLSVLAEKGDPRSQMAFGILLATNPDVNAQYKEGGFRWFLKAGQAGLPSGQYFVARHLEAGVGVEKDPVKARRWFELAAKSESPGSMVSLANYELRQTGDAAARARGVDLLRRAAEARNWLAQFYLAALMAADSGAKWHDPKRALQLIEELNGGFDYDPVSFEIRAAAHAALGNFDRAKLMQARAIREARYIKWDVTAMQARLASYQAGKPWNGELIEF